MTFVFGVFGALLAIVGFAVGFSSRSPKRPTSGQGGSLHPPTKSGQRK